MSRLLLLMLMVTGGYSSIHATALEDYKLLLEEIRAINRGTDAKNELRHRSLIEQAINRFPHEAELYMERADFYHQRKEYQLEVDDYLQAETLLYNNPSYLFSKLAESYSLLGDNDRSLFYGSKVVALAPYDEEARSQQLWYFLKTFKLEEGLAAGYSALAIFPSSTALHSMMALIHMGLNHYKESSYFFTEAIALALVGGQVEQASMNLYNIYLLESNFYHYDKAEAALRKALSLSENSSNYRLLGSLYRDQLHYSNAIFALKKSEELEFYESSYSGVERTPLGRLLIAETELLFGHLAQAKDALDESKKIVAVSWMINYGINQNIYRYTLYKNYAKLWSLEAKQLRYRLKKSIWQSINSQYKILMAKFYTVYYDHLSRYYAKCSGDDLFSANNQMAAYKYYQSATVGYRQQHSYFIMQAQAIEERLAPHAQHHYQALKGYLDRDKHQILRSYDAFDPIYEKSSKQNLLTNLIKISRGSVKRGYIEELYSLNNAAVISYRMPVTLRIDDSVTDAKKLKKYLLQALSHHELSRFIIDVRQDDQLIFKFYDKDVLVFTEKYDYNKKSFNSFTMANLIVGRLYNDY